MAPDRTADEFCARIAATQFGLLSRAQAVAAGLSEAAIRHRVRTGRWRPVRPGVFEIHGAPASFRRDCMAVALWCGEGGAMSHRSAAALLGLDGFGLGLLEASTTRPLRKPDGVVVHRFESLPRGEVTRAGPIPVTTAARTILDLGAVSHIDRVDAALDSALRLQLTTLDELRETLVRHAARGRGGIRIFRVLLHARGIDPSPTASRLELSLHRLIERSGRLPRPVKQYPVHLDGTEVRWIDFAYPDEMVGIEAESYKFHSGKVAWSKDIGRLNQLVARGWRMLRFTDRDVKERPEWVIDQIDEALATARFLRGSRASGSP